MKPRLRWFSCAHVASPAACLALGLLDPPSRPAPRIAARRAYRDRWS
jgi:hypothetical protein